MYITLSYSAVCNFVPSDVTVDTQPTCNCHTVWAYRLCMHAHYAQRIVNGPLQYCLNRALVPTPSCNQNAVTKRSLFLYFRGL